MSYVFDNSPLSALFRNYYRKAFPTLWARFDKLVADNRLVSTREVLREIEDGPIESLRDWAAQERHLFSTPTALSSPPIRRRSGFLRGWSRRHSGS